MSAYAITTHSSWEMETWRSRCIVGSATFTTVLSSMIMKRPNETANDVHHLRFSSARLVQHPCSHALSCPKLALTS